VIVPPAAVTLMVYDPKNAMNQTGFEDPFEKGVTLNGSIQVGTRWFERSGKHIFTGAWSSRDGIDLGELQELFLPPGSADTLSTTANRWYVSYAFEQTLWRSDREPQRAVGLFGQAALSDGNPNPAHWSVLGGLSGTSLIPGRRNDRFGVAAFFYAFSDALKDGLRPVRLGDEYGGEVFYNLAVTPWFRVTADLQVISPALGDSPVVLLGWRAQLKL
jgi:porin